ncbi:MAG: hypothetical protein ACKOCD_01855 [Nitrospiraceae bacterium]
MNRLIGTLGLLATGWVLVSGCAAFELEKEYAGAQAPIVFGRATTVLTAQSGRRYQPKVRFFELVRTDTGQRYRVDLQSADKQFALELPTGQYNLRRVQVSEGPFLSMADLDITFDVGTDPMVYVGTWRFGIDSPRYDRRVLVSVIQDEESRAEAAEPVLTRYPDLVGRSVATSLLTPPSAESRLHEVMPYPNYPRYYRRHWW